MAVAVVVGVGAGTTADIDAPPTCFLEICCLQGSLEGPPQIIGSHAYAFMPVTSLGAEPKVAGQAVSGGNSGRV